MIRVLTEGRTEVALKQLLSAEVKQMAERGVSLRITTVQGKERLIKEAAVLVRNAVADGAAYVFALVDLYPEADPSSSVSDVRQRMISAVSSEHRDQFRPHVAVHDVEAWMLASWDALCRVAGCPGQKCKYPSPERVNHTKPPKKHVDELLRRYRKRGYRETVDGRRVLELADPDEIARKCPHFRAFREDILKCAGVRR